MSIEKSKKVKKLVNFLDVDIKIQDSIVNREVC